MYVHELTQRTPHIRHLVAATCGNHGLSLGFAAKRHGIAAHMVVPRGNSTEKNMAMRASGIDLIEYGIEYQECAEHAALLAQKNDWHLVPGMHPDLVSGAASCWMELFRAQPDLDFLFVSIGQGSNICAAVAARQALGLKTKIIGVVSAHALAYKSSFDAGYKIAEPVSTKLADGLACRVPDDASLEIILNSVDRVIAVSDTEVAAAMKLLFVSTHNVAEGAGAAALAAAYQMRKELSGLKVGLPLCGGNVNAKLFSTIIGAEKVTENSTWSSAEEYASPVSD